MLFNVIKRNISNHSSLSHQLNSLTQKHKHVKKGGSGLFGNQLLSHWNGFSVFKQDAIVQANQLVNEAMSPNRQRKMVKIFDELSNCLCRVADLAEFIRIAHPSRQYAAAAEEASIAINAKVEQLNINRNLYNSLLNTVQHGDIVPTSQTDDYVSKLFLFDFEQSGIHLSEDLRKEVVQLNEHILRVGSYFNRGTANATILSKSEVPGSLLKYFQVDGDRVIITGLQNDSSDASLREFTFKQFLRYNDNQEKALLELIYSRLKLSKICGFKSFAHRAINGSIAETPETVWNLINDVNELIKPNTEKDFSDMLKLKCIHQPNSNGLFQWDIPYYTQHHKVMRFSQDIKNASPYFSLGTCMEGLDTIFMSIFNVQLVICDTNDEDLWHPSVIKLAAKDLTDNSILGYIYCDFFVRPDKPYHDCHFTIQGGCELSNGDYQLPVVVLFLNFPNASSQCPTLLSPSMVDNLFHEMGHGMHSMLARTAYQHITGTRCSTDLAEVPSILMENFASDPRVVSKFAKHYETGKPINERLLKSWIDSKNVFSASDLQLQIFYSALDQVYHSDDPLRNQSATTTQVLNDVQKKYYGIPNNTSWNTSWQLRFSHLVGYGAKYYSYLVSKAVANSVWDKLFQSDPLSSMAGQSFRENVLVHGGGKPPKQIVESVLGEPVTGTSLANSLVKNIKDNYK